MGLCECVCVGLTGTPLFCVSLSSTHDIRSNEYGGKNLML